jgi:hypothetical protein
MNSLPNEFQTDSSQGQTASQSVQLHLTEKTPYLTSQGQTKGQSLSCLSDAQTISQFYHKYPPDRPQYIKSLFGKDFKTTILKELRESGISDEAIALNVEIVNDLEFDPVTKEVLGTPIAEALGFTYTRFGRQAKENETAVLFIGADGEVWQAKIFGDDAEVWLKTYQNQGKRTGRYIAPKEIGDKPFLPNIPDEIANRAIAKYCTPLAESDWLEARQNGINFWAWFKKHPEIPVIVTEGAKKALAAISQGHIALALFGCTCGVTDLTIKPELLPYVKDREVIIAYDRDAEKEKQHKVFKFTKKLGNALTYHAKSKVKVMTWDGKLGKGLDDLIARDPETAIAAIENARDFTRWKLDNYCDLSELVSLKVNIPDLTALTIPDHAKLICFKSPKKTYKTELIVREIQKAINAGIPVFVFSHREQLVKELARRFGLEYRTELTQEGKLFGYALCVDSAHPKANPPFYGDAPEWEGCWVVFDECEQVFWHSLNSDTCKNNRTAILKTLTNLVGQAGRIFLADADLTRISIDYVNSMRDKDNQLTPYVVVNEYKHPPRHLYTFDKPEYLFSKVIKLLKDGQKLIIHTGGKKEKSTWGTTNLESLIKKAFPHLKVLRIDRNTVADPSHSAYGCISKLNQILPNYDVVLASPTIETGVSIECHHFDGVCCFANGSQTVEAVGQTLERDRSDVPRYLWATKQAHWNKIGSGSTDVSKLLNDDKKLSKINGTLSNVDSFYDSEDGNTRHRLTWAKMAARHNLGFSTYRESIYALLGEDFRLHDGQLDTSEDDIEKNKKTALTTATINHSNYCEKVAEAPLLDDSSYDSIRKKRNKTEEERLAEKKTAIAHRYATENVTSDLVDKDSDFDWYRTIQLHYLLTVGSEFLLHRDHVRVSQLAKNTGKVFSPDANRACLAATIKALEAVNIGQFLVLDKTWTKYDLEAWHNDLISKRNDIKTFTGVAIGANKDDKNNGPIRCAKRLLAKLGLDLVPVDCRRINGEPTKVYRLATLNPDGRIAIFERWAEMDRSVQKNVV